MNTVVSYRVETVRTLLKKKTVKTGKPEGNGMKL